MKLVKTPPLPLLMALLVVAGVACILAGAYMLTSLAVTLIVGGTLAAAFGLMADV